MPQTNCRHFNGYKPCGFNDVCDNRCTSFTQAKVRILIVHLGAMGAVLRSTALLHQIHDKYPSASITWVTQKPSDQLLRNHSRIDRVLTTERDDLLTLSCLEFDIAFCIDKSTVAAGVLKKTKYKTLFGFYAHSETGAILPANDEAEELWQIGLSNHTKFFVNKKTETQLVAEALALPYKRDEYDIRLSALEEKMTSQRRSEWAVQQMLVVGINTGCSPVIPYKKLSVEKHRQLIELLTNIGARIVLLGGPEDRIRNQQIAYGLNVINTPTDQGLRDGLISVNACDTVITGDSLGMHMAIALKKWTVAWFGPTCDHEIDLYDRGVKIITSAPCSPCWKRSCHNNPMCYDQVDLNQIVEGVRQGVSWLTSSSIPRLSVISSSTSPSLKILKESSQPNL